MPVLTNGHTSDAGRPATITIRPSRRLTYGSARTAIFSNGIRERAEWSRRTRQPLTRWHRCCSKCSFPPSSSTFVRRPAPAIPAFMSVFHLLAFVLVAPSILHPLISPANIRASAASCSPTSQQFEVSSSTSNLSSVFDCEGGTFDVTWSGIVNLTETIRVGSGTTVSIVGDYENGLVATSGDTSSGAAVVGMTGAPFGPIFYSSGSTMSLTNLAIRNGNATSSVGTGISSGGGVYAMNSNITVSGCAFEDNFAQDYGGGIRVNQSTLVVVDTVFKHCSAGDVPETGDENADGSGGGISVWYGSVSLDGAQFEKCYASKRGGGLHQIFSTFSMVNSSFINNTAGGENVKNEDAIGEGGAISFSRCIYGFQNVGSCSVNTSTFMDNGAAAKGGAIQISGDTGASFVEFNRCLVSNNSAGTNIEDDPQGDGGAFSVGTGVSLLLEECVVQTSYAGNKGGAVTLSGGDSWEEPGATVIVRNSTFEDNSSGGDDGGVIYCSDFSTTNIMGDDNTFAENSGGINGGVLAATSDSNITIEGGTFHGNFAGEHAGVFWTKGSVTITGGQFLDNESADRGGVFDVGDGGVIRLVGGTFTGNKGGDDGGVGFVTTGAQVFISGGNYTKNIAEIGGGAFNVETNATLEITGGTFLENQADFGGFLYKEGTGLTSCSGTSIDGHWGVNGGALYALGEANLNWECDLVNNEALAGPAIFALHNTTITLDGMELQDNQVSRGSVVFIVGSDLRTYEVVFSDSTGSSDLSAVQTDGESTYYADQTVFEGFAGETVVFSEGVLVLDSCDFSGSVASELVRAEGDKAVTTVRNAVLGDSNYAAPADSTLQGELPSADDFINVNLTCDDGIAGDASNSSQACSEGSLCLDGDLGIYCQCYEAISDNTETCVSSDPEAQLQLTLSTEPEATYYPSLPQGDLILLLTGSDDDDIDTNGVVWNVFVNASEEEFMAWTIFPSTGILFPDQSTTLRVVSVPSVDFDGTREVTFRAEGMGLSTSQTVVAEASVNFTFYHCEAGKYWNITSGANDTIASCTLCTEADGLVEGLDCENPGVSTKTLPLLEGYWRASTLSTFIWDCSNTDACTGGDVVEVVDDYCADGYEGPFCGVCSTGYGRGASNSCHVCSEAFKKGMYFVAAIGALLGVVAMIFTAIFLVGGLSAVMSALDSSRESARSIRRRGLSILPTRLSMCSQASNDSKKKDSSRGVSRLSHADDPNADTLSGTGQSNLQSSAKNCVAPSHSSGHSSDSGDNHLVKDSSFKNGKCCGLIPNPRSEEAPRRSLPRTDFDDGTARTSTLSKGRVFLMEDSDHSLADETGQNVPWGEKQEDAVQSTTQNQSVVYSLEKEGDTREVRRVMGFSVHSTGVSVEGNKRRDEAMSASSKDKKDDGRRQRGPKRNPMVLLGSLGSKIPLSKLKIVIVVWQILSAFTDITQVPMPPIYEKFLSFIGIFTFDLGWIFSAACLTDGINFYDQLLIITIGPALILCFLGITFWIGVRRFKRRSPFTYVTYADPVTWATRRDERPVEKKRPQLSSAVLGFSTYFVHSKPTSVPPQPAAKPAPVLDETNGHNEQQVAKHQEEMVQQGANTDSTEAPLPSSLPRSPHDTVGGAGTRELESNQRSRSSSAAGRGSALKRGLSWLSHKSGVRTPGPEGHMSLQQNELWWLFARHTTVTLIILYLVYTQVSTVVFQTFSCESLPEVGKKYLRADLSLECDTDEHMRYQIYAGFMIFLYPVGIPVAFCFFLMRQRSNINPLVDLSNEELGKEKVLREKLEKRSHDQTVAPTSVLWGAYFPNRYYYEVCECVRRLLLTGLLVFFLPNTPGQVAIGCVMAFLSLLMFELLRPHVDPLDIQLYRAGCLVIFFSDFLALMIKAEVTDADSNGSALYSVCLVAVNVLLVLSVWWNIWATTSALFSRSHVQGELLGFDAIGESQLARILGDEPSNESSRKSESAKEPREAGPAWDRQPSYSVESGYGVPSMAGDSSDDGGDVSRDKSVRSSHQ